MAEKWRVMVVLAGAAADAVWRCKRDLARDMRDRAGVVVVGVPDSAWRDSAGSPVSAYTNNRTAAEAAAHVAEEVAGQHGLAARVSVECWRPVKEQWEDGSAVSDLDLAEDHDHEQREDRRLTAETGVAQWRVRVELRTHRDAVALAQRLASDGHQVDRKWKSVMAGAASEDDAGRLAAQIREYAPPAADVCAERADDRDWTRAIADGGPGIPF